MILMVINYFLIYSKINIFLRQNAAMQLSCYANNFLRANSINFVELLTHTNFTKFLLCVISLHLERRSFKLQSKWSIFKYYYIKCKHRHLKYMGCTLALIHFDINMLFIGWYDSQKQCITCITCRTAECLHVASWILIKLFGMRVIPISRG